MRKNGLFLAATDGDQAHAQPQRRQPGRFGHVRRGERVECRQLFGRDGDRAASCKAEVGLQQQEVAEVDGPVEVEVPVAEHAAGPELGLED